MRNARYANDAKPSAVDGANFTDWHLPEQLSFLLLPFNPSWPIKGIRDDQALHLHNACWPIVFTDITTPTPACPDRKITVYHLPAKYAAEELAQRNGGFAA